MPMMKCGHEANATCSQSKNVVYDPPIPSCVICDCLELAESTPDLTDRVAKCAYASCKSKKPSAWNLAFFEYKGEGSPYSQKICKHCRYAQQAHTKFHHDRNKNICDNFEPIGAAEYDSFYCGCYGWD